MATIDEPVNARILNSDASMSGLRARAQCSANSARAAAAAASVRTVGAEPHPQSLPLTSPSVSAPTPAVTRKGRSALPGRRRRFALRSR